MGTKNYEKGFGCVEFYFRRSRDADLRWRIYGLSKVYRRKAYGKDIGNYFWNFLDGGEGMGNVWVGSGVSLIFIGIFWEFSGRGKRLTSTLVYTSLVCLSFSACRALCRWTGVGHCAMDRSLHLLVHVHRVYGGL
jgi:hypothetical protein